MGVYVVRTSSLNDKHSCQLFRIASSLVLLSSSLVLLLSVSMTNLSCLLATTFSSLRFLFNFTSLQSFESGQRGFLFSHFRVLSSILSLSFLCASVSEALFTLSFSFLSERFFFVHDKAALACSRNQHGCHRSVFTSLLSPNYTRKMFPIKGRASASFSSMLKLKRIGNE